MPKRNPNVRHSRQRTINALREREVGDRREDLLRDLSWRDFSAYVDEVCAEQAPGG